MVVKTYVMVNEAGRRIGESHPRARLTDHEIDLIRELHEGGLGYKKIAKKFDTGRETIRDIVRCKKRAQIPARLKRVPETA
jgi:transposase